MNDSHTERGRAATLFCAVLACGLAACGSPEKTEEECVEPAADTGKQPDPVERVPLGVVKPDPEKADWCRACVMSLKGFASCQRVFALKEGEPREVLRGRARAKACDDAGFAGGSCPDGAVIAQACKGDPRPDGGVHPGQALQQIYLKMNQGEAPSKPSAEPAAPAAPAEPTPGDGKTYEIE